MSELTPSIATPKVFMIGELGVILAFRYLLGIYTGVYVITAYIYLYKGHASLFQKTLVLSTITTLYIILCALDLINWYSVSMVFQKRGYSRPSVFNAITAGEYTPEISVLVNILQCVSLILSDVLMLWRCFHACGRSFARFLLPLGFFVAECTLIVTEISLFVIGFLNPEMNTPRRIDQANIIGAATFGSVAATSVTSTLIICRAIYSNTPRGGRYRARYKYIADIIIQSSAIYSTLMLLLFILQLMDLFDFALGIHIADIFIVNLAFGMTRFLPTLMVARLAIGSEKANTEFIYEDLPYSGEQNSDDTEDPQKSNEQDTDNQLVMCTSTLEDRPPP